MKNTTKFLLSETFSLIGLIIGGMHIAWGQIFFAILFLAFGYFCYIQAIYLAKDLNYVPFWARWSK